MIMRILFWNTHRNNNINKYEMHDIRVAVRGIK